MGAFGLQTHIWNNELKSALLLAGFPLLLLVLLYALALLFAGFVGAPDPFIAAADHFTRLWPFALVGAGLWFAIAFFSHQAIIDASVGARALSRIDAPKAYNLLENLCISRGMPMPALRIIETDALNAFASGLTEARASVTVTRGLIDTLSEPQLEAVLAHELTHIRNRDVRLLVIAVVFVGIFSFVGEAMSQALRSGVRLSGAPRRSSQRDRDGGGGGGGAALIAIVVALALIALSYALAIAIRFALSRRREFLADAGAVELTKDPDALISALRTISGRSTIPRAPAEVREMFFDNAAARFGDAFATHPPIESRIAALVRFAGGRDDATPEPGPWGARS